MQTSLQASMIVNARWDDWSEEEDESGADEVGGAGCVLLLVGELKSGVVAAGCNAALLQGASRIASGCNAARVPPGLQ